MSEAILGLISLGSWGPKVLSYGRGDVWRGLEVEIRKGWSASQMGQGGRVGCLGRAKTGCGTHRPRFSGLNPLVGGDLVVVDQRHDTADH